MSKESNVNKDSSKEKQRSFQEGSYPFIAGRIGSRKSIKSLERLISLISTNNGVNKNE